MKICLPCLNNFLCVHFWYEFFFFSKKKSFFTFFPLLLEVKLWTFQLHLTCMYVCVYVYIHVCVCSNTELYLQPFIDFLNIFFLLFLIFKLLFWLLLSFFIISCKQFNQNNVRICPYYPCWNDKGLWLHVLFVCIIIYLAFCHCVIY